MNKKRKSCPVYEREFIVIENFKESETPFDGTETVRGINKFTKEFFSKNKIVVISTSTTFQGKTFIVPFIDKEGTRYWISDPLRKERLHKEKLERQKYLLSNDIAKKEDENKDTKLEFNGVYIGDGVFLVNEENYEKIMKEKPSISNSIKNYNSNIEETELYKIDLSNLLEFEKGCCKCSVEIKSKSFI